MEVVLFKKELVLPSSLNGLRTCHDFLKEIEELLDMDECHFFCLQTVVLEAVENAIFHGNQLSENKRVTLKVVAGSKLIDVTITDEGDGFKLEDISDPTSNERIMLENGRGIYIMNKMADDFQVVGKGNVVRFSIKYK